MLPGSGASLILIELAFLCLKPLSVRKLFDEPSDSRSENSDLLLCSPAQVFVALLMASHTPISKNASKILVIICRGVSTSPCLQTWYEAMVRL